jgi:hypothetical protein
VLDELRERLDPRRTGELPELCKLLLAVNSLREDAEDEPALRLRPGGGIGLARGHPGIMPRGGSPLRGAVRVSPWTRWPSGSPGERWSS